MSIKWKCRVCEGSDFRSLVDLGLSPLANSYISPRDVDADEIFYPLHVRICTNCQLAQLRQYETREKIFDDDYAYFSSFSSSWVAHSRSFVEQITKDLLLDTSSHVVEAASNDGYLLKWFVQAGVKVTGVEPALGCALEARRQGVYTEVSFFGKETARDLRERRGSAQLIIANNVLAHVPDLNDFVGGVKELLSLDGIATFEFPHLLRLIQECQFDTIYHEHFSYFSLRPLIYLFEQFNLRIFRIEKLTTHGGSLRVYVCSAISSRPEDSSVQEVLHEEEVANLYSYGNDRGFQNRVTKVKTDFWRFLADATDNKKKICGYGAPAKGNTFLNFCGVSADQIPFTVDANPAKVGKYLPGTRVPIVAVSELKSFKPDFIVVLPWNLSDEIFGVLQEFTESGTRLVTAIPELRIR